MKKFIEEFKTFAMRGNVIDMAVGVMIASAFGKIVTSLVNDLFMPLLSLLTGRVDFSSLGIKLSDAEDGAVFAYGNFIQTLIDFVLIALCIFLLDLDLIRPIAALLQCIDEASIGLIE